jgi:hypothetical protein
MFWVHDFQAWQRNSQHTECSSQAALVHVHVHVHTAHGGDGDQKAPKVRFLNNSAVIATYREVLYS